MRLGVLVFGAKGSSDSSRLPFDCMTRLGCCFGCHFLVDGTRRAKLYIAVDSVLLFFFLAEFVAVGTRQGFRFDSILSALVAAWIRSPLGVQLAEALVTESF